MISNLQRPRYIEVHSILELQSELQMWVIGSHGNFRDLR